jgi:hypothetical protein
MPILPANQAFVDAFFAAIQPVEGAYCDVQLSYLALRAGEQFEIIRARVVFNTSPTYPFPPNFISPNVRAGRFRLTKTDVRSLIASLNSGEIKTPDGELRFPEGSGGYYTATFVPFHPDGLKTQTRLNVLTLFGSPIEALQQPDLDWEIKAASQPYDGLQDLAEGFSVGPIRVSNREIEVIAPNVGAIDPQNSTILGNDAKVHVLLAKDLSPDHVTLGYRIFETGLAPQRAMISGQSLTWTEEATLQRGQVDIPIGNASALNCVVSYQGIAQSHFWIMHPERVPNSRRAAYEAFDPQSKNLQDIVSSAQRRGQNARDLEAAVAWLFWMLGFGTAQLGAIPRTQDAADLIVTTPAGHFAVVECTTGLLRAENKLSLLLDRAAAVRRRLDASNNAHLRVLPVIVTSKTVEEIKADVEAAEKLGVLIQTRENLDQWIFRTQFIPNPDQMYVEAEQAVSQALAKIRTGSPR